MSVIQTEAVNESWRNGKLVVFFFFFFCKDSHLNLIYDSNINNKYQLNIK